MLLLLGHTGYEDSESEALCEVSKCAKDI